VARLEFTKEAAADLRDIWGYIHDQNPDAATRLVALLDEHCKFLADNPMAGQARPEIRPDLRYFPVRTYLIFYRPIAGGVEIVRVVHGRRNLHALFDTEDL
jgi:toxin ParE1/3/4